MDSNIFTPSKSQNDITDTFSDTSKITIITEKLCGKRKALEETIKNASDSNRDTLALELFDLQNSMRTFGISEIDYQAYIARVYQS